MEKEKPRVEGEVKSMSESVGKSLLKVQDAAKLLLTSENNVYALVRQSAFPAGVLCRVSPVRGIRFNRAALSAWIERGGLAQTPLPEGSESAIAA
jgi:predicted DNA-binding transcriptional regulator AlpA